MKKNVGMEIFAHSGRKPVVESETKKLGLYLLASYRQLGKRKCCSRYFYWFYRKIYDNKSFRKLLYLEKKMKNTIIFYNISKKSLETEIRLHSLFLRWRPEAISWYNPDFLVLWLYPWPSFTLCKNVSLNYNPNIYNIQLKRERKVKKCFAFI